MPDLVITRGLPGSGKTTWAEAWRDLAENRVRISRDDLRHTLFRQYSDLTPEQETRVTKAQHEAVRAWLKHGVDVCVDDTNLNMKTVKQWQKIAQEEGATLRNVDFQMSWPDCVERIDKRVSEGGRHVPDSVVANMHQRYLRRGFPVIKPLPEPVKCAPYVPDPSLLPAYIFDMDGTLTTGPHNRSPYEWHKVGQDLPRADVLSVAEDLSFCAHIIIVSGRDGSCERETRGWLTTQKADFYRALFMRAPGDMRRDDIVKAEIFDREIRDQYNVLGVFDDRDQVVKFWRSIGLTCYQVAEGNF